MALSAIMRQRLISPLPDPAAATLFGWSQVGMDRVQREGAEKKDTQIRRFNYVLQVSYKEALSNHVPPYAHITDNHKEKDEECARFSYGSF